MVDSVLADSNEVILFGDFNCDFLVKRSASNITKQLKLLFKAYNFTQLINEPTRAAPDSVSLLDLIVTNRPSVISHSGVLSCGLSDHDMVYCVQKLHCKKFPSEVKMFRTCTNYNPQKFCNDLNDVNWESNIDVVPGSQAENLTYVDQLWISFKN